MSHPIASANYLTQLIQIYKNTPSLAIWRAFEARAFDNIVFEPPTLDLACGTGKFGKLLFGNRISSGCDIDKEAITIAEKEKTYRALVVADARRLPYSDDSFNSVLSNCALEHIPGVEEVIAEVARVLRPMGLFVFTVPSQYFNDFLLLPLLYRFFGLHSHAGSHIQWYNSVQKHCNIDPLPVWEKRLNKFRFTLVLRRYYMPYWATLVFSLWDAIDKWTIRTPIKRGRVYPQQFLLNLLPHRLLSWALYHHVIGWYNSSSHSTVGSGLLIAARREQK